MEILTTFVPLHTDTANLCARTLESVEETRTRAECVRDHSKVSGRLRRARRAGLCGFQGSSPHEGRSVSFKQENVTVQTTRESSA